MEKMFYDIFKKNFDRETLEKIFVEKFKEEINSTASDIAENLFGRYSFRDEIQKSLTKKIGLDIERMTFGEYQKEINKDIEQILTEEYKKGSGDIKNKINNILNTEKKEYELQEILDVVIDEYEGDEISLTIEKSSSFCFIYFDEEPGKENYDCCYRLVLKEGKVNDFRSNEGRKMICSERGDVEGLIKKIFYSGSTINVPSDSEDDYNLKYYEESEEDY